MSSQTWQRCPLYQDQCWVRLDNTVRCTKTNVESDSTSLPAVPGQMSSKSRQGCPLYQDQCWVRLDNTVHCTKTNVESDSTALPAVPGQMSIQTRQRCPLYQNKCRAQIDMLLYSYFTLVFPKLLCLVTAFDIWTLEIFRKINLEQSVGIHKNNLDCKGLCILITSETPLNIRRNHMQFKHGWHFWNHISGFSNPERIPASVLQRKQWKQNFSNSNYVISKQIPVLHMNINVIKFCFDSKHKRPPPTADSNAIWSYFVVQSANRAECFWKECYCIINRTQHVIIVSVQNLKTLWNNDCRNINNFAIRVIFSLENTR
jgi:hypothetical protein